MGRRKGSKNKPKTKSKVYAKALKEVTKKAAEKEKVYKRIEKQIKKNPPYSKEELKKGGIVITSQKGVTLIEEDLLPTGKVHAKFGSPSNMKRTEECPGWLAFGKDLPDLPATEYSLEGDCFHSVMEKCAEKYLTKAPIKAELNAIPAEYAGLEEYVWKSLDKLEQLWNSFKSKHDDAKYYFELKVKLNEYIFGTSDVVFSGVNKKTRDTDLVTIDWKTGKGVFVSAEENLQGITYLLAAIKTLEIESPGVCVVIIAQVRLQDDWEENRYVIRNELELKSWHNRIVDNVELARDIYEDPKLIKGNLHAGDHCRFCKCAPVCPEQKKRNFDPLSPMLVKAAEFPAGDEQKTAITKAVKRLTLEEQVEVFHKRGLIEDFLSAVASNLHRAFSTGITHKSLKLIRTNGRRKWRDDLSEEKLAKKLIKLGFSDPWKKKLVPLTTVEKEIDINDLIEVGQGKVELVSIKDKRRAITVSEPEEFEI